ncbi:RTA1 domain-containing protein [Aspergillus stella-maris]|uniref:RTA1 domain-containing protein n=1 Tax=Aspergillus stella-maris TaxID=1810926 RepID=UPI003CCDE129
MGESGYYPYEPSSIGEILAMLLFGGSAIVHTVQICKTRTWFFTAFLIGAYSYIFRLISARKPNSLVAYVCQSKFIILPPSLYAATIYMTYGRIVTYIDKPHLTIIRPQKVTKVFVIGDVSAFLLQLAGGGMQTINSMRNIGQKILVIGLLVQLIFFGFFLYVSGNFQNRLRQCGYGWFGGGRWRRLLHILLLVSVLVIGYLYSHEAYAYLFDAIPMFFVQAVFHFYHPGKILIGKILEVQTYVNLQDI